VLGGIELPGLRPGSGMPVDGPDVGKPSYKREVPRERVVLVGRAPEPPKGFMVLLPDRSNVRAKQVDM